MDSQDLLRDHETLMSQVDRLSTLARAGDLSASSPELATLEAELRSHFAAEETGGYFVDVREARPDLDRRLAQLEAEHGDMLGMMERLRGVSGSPEVFARDFEALVGLLRDHEGRERSLVADAAFQDLGVGD